MNSSNRNVIDCHIHPRFDAATDGNWFGSSGGVKKQMDTLRRAGITRACGAPILFRLASFRDVRKLNDGALRLRDKCSGFYIPGIQVHPRYPEESCREIDRCCGGEGVRWIGELVGYKMGYGEEFATPDALTVMRQAEKHRAVVNFHCANLVTVEKLCTAVPGVAFVLAHPGAQRPDFLERVKTVARIPNLHLDFSGSGIDRYGCVRCAMDTAGKRKLLFGSDFPVNNPAVHLQGILFESLTESEQTAILSGNFLRLIGEPRS